MKKLLAALAFLLLPLAAQSAPGGPSGVLVVDTLAHMTGLTATALQTNPDIQLLGYNSAGDGGGGQFHYFSTSSSTADHCTIFSPSSGSGRIVRQNVSAITLRQCGAAADASADDTNPWSYALLYGASSGHPINPEGLGYKVTSGLTIDVCHTSILPNGGYITAPGFTNQTLWTITFNGASGLCSDVNKLDGLIASHPISGMTFYGPGAGTSTTCVVLSPYTITGTPWIQNVTLTDGGCYGFGTGVTIGDGSFALNMSNYQLTAGAIGINLTGSTNCCERDTITGGFINNNTGYDVVVNSTGGDYHFYNASLDGEKWIDKKSSAYVAFDGHLENFGTERSCLLYDETGDGGIAISATTAIIIDISKALPIGCSNSSSTGGITFGGYLSIGATTYSADTLASGTGPIRASSLTWLSTPGKIPLGAAANLFRDGDYTSSDAINDWTSTGGVTITYDNTTGCESTGSSMKWTSTGGTGLAKSLAFPVGAGRTNSLNFQIKTTGINSSGGAIAPAVSYYADAALTKQIGSSVNLAAISADLASCTLERFQFPAVIPAGAQYEQITAFINPMAGTITANLDMTFTNTY